MFVALNERLQVVSDYAFFYRASPIYIWISSSVVTVFRGNQI